MYTCCPHCQSAQPVSASSLRKASGRFSCRHCSGKFNALDYLSDDYPDATLNRKQKRQESEQRTLREAARTGALDKPLAQVADTSRARPWQWTLAALTLITAINLGWAFRGHIPPDSAVGMKLYDLGFSEFAPPQQFRDADRIHLVSRDIHPHPSRPDVLVLSATFVNLAEQSQPYPSLILSMLNSEGHPLAARRLEPSQYLSEEKPQQSLLAPRQHVPLLIEFADPGDQAVGFEMQFN